MMVWNAVRRILVESRLSDALQKYPDFEDEIKAFTDADPTQNAKYLSWQLKMLSSGQASAQNIIDLTALFHRLRLSVDINRYDSFAKLQSELQHKQAAREKKHNAAKARFSVKDPSATVIYQTPEVIVRAIHNKDAGVRYGSNTAWCTTMNTQVDFDTYAAENCIIFYMDDLANNDKYALTYSRDSKNAITDLDIRDSADTGMTDTEFLADSTDGGNVLRVTREFATAAPQTTQNKNRKTPEEKAIEEEAADKAYKDGLRAKLASKSADELRNLYLTMKFPDIDYLEVQYVLNAPNISRDLKALIEKERADKLAAKSKNTAPDELTKLTQHRISGVRTAAIFNSMLPADTLRKLVDDPKVNSNTICLHEPLPHDLAMKFSSSEKESDRYYVAMNPTTSEEILKYLVKDPSDSVATEARKNLEKRQPKHESLRKMIRFSLDSILKN